MARLAVGVVFGVVVGMFAGAACGIRADEEPIAEAAPDLEETAPEVVPARDWIDTMLDCLAWHESRGLASAYNRSSGASGLLQFLPKTWMSTPQGKRGESIWNAEAQRRAGRWMIESGRLREWTTWSLCV